MSNDFQNEENNLYSIDPKRIINKEHFNKFKEILNCKICYKILNNPFDCTICGNSFCQNCINQIKENSLNCPFNCKNFNTKPSSFGITNILNSLNFSCLNFESGCIEEINYESVKEHDCYICKFAYLNCPNVNCKEQIKRIDLEYHLNHQCNSSLFKCETCKKQFSRKEFIEHHQICELISKALVKNKNKNSNSLAASFSNGFFTNSNINNAQINENEDIEAYKIFMENEIKDLNFDNFLKIMLFNFGKFNKNLENKLDSLKEEIKEFKGEIFHSNKLINKNFSNFSENLQREMDVMNDKISMVMIKEQKIPSNKNLDNSLGQISSESNFKTNANTSLIEDLQIITEQNDFPKKSNLNKLKNTKSEKNLTKFPINVKNNSGKNEIFTKGRAKIELGKSLKIKESNNLSPRYKEEIQENSNKINLRMTNIKEALLETDKSPNQRSTVKFEDSISRSVFNFNDGSNTRERSLNRFGDKGNNYVQPIQTSYEAVKANLKNNETIIEILNSIKEKIDCEIAKEEKLEYVIELIKEKNKLESSEFIDLKIC